MKLNWGTSIVIAFIAFIGFILFFVIRMNMDDRANHDLVTEDYYRAELAYQKEIDAENNTHAHAVDLDISKTPEGLLIAFPRDLNYRDIAGTVSLYRPSRKQLDFDVDLNLSDAHLLIPDKRLPDGRWDIKVAWTYDNETYLYKKKLTY